MLIFLSQDDVLLLQKASFFPITNPIKQIGYLRKAMAKGIPGNPAPRAYIQHILPFTKGSIARLSNR